MMRVVWVGGGVQEGTLGVAHAVDGHCRPSSRAVVQLRRPVSSTFWIHPGCFE